MLRAFVVEYSVVIVIIFKHRVLLVQQVLNIPNGTSGNR